MATVQYFLNEQNKHENKTKQNPQALQTEFICSKIRACFYGLTAKNDFYIFKGLLKNKTKKEYVTETICRMQSLTYLLSSLTGNVCRWKEKNLVFFGKH